MKLLLIFVAVLAAGCPSIPKATDPGKYTAKVNRQNVGSTFIREPENEKQRRINEKINVLFADVPGFRREADFRGKVVKRPTLLKPHPPTYPKAGVRYGVEGEAVVGVLVGKDGSVSYARVIESTWPGFNEAAIDAASKWKFAGGTVEGEPTAFVMVIPFDFKLSPAK